MFNCNHVRLLTRLECSMKMNEKKEVLLKQLHNFNSEAHTKLFDGESVGDLCAFEDMYYAKALRYVPNNVLKKWIKNCKDELKIDAKAEEVIEVVNENTN